MDEATLDRYGQWPFKRDQYANLIAELYAHHAGLVVWGVMMPEAELLLMNASRAQLVLEVIRPALTAGEIVLCDRFYDSTTAYQGYGRQLDLSLVKSVIDFAVGRTRPNLTLLLQVPTEVSEARRQARQAATSGPRDRFEEADRAFFRRVEHGFQQIADAEPERVRVVDATQGIEFVHDDIWRLVAPHLTP
ncbi:MAG: dTMP kinase [Verrucomicrobia bacterium]|nr:dTMP kinase [Verrucomicrobiota bacterium]